MRTPKPQPTTDSSPLTEGHLLVRCASHRARQSLHRLLQAKPIGWFSWGTACSGGFVEVPIALLQQATAITGITVASGRFTYQRCWYHR
jgi:hypothetical protein